MPEENVVDAVEEKKVKGPSAKETKAIKVQAEADAVDFTDEVFYDTEAESWPILSRAAAVLLGFRRYNTGEPCIHNHNSPRKTKSSTCLVCARLKLRARHTDRMANDPDYKAKQAEKAKARRVANKAKKVAEAPESPAEA